MKTVRANQKFVLLAHEHVRTREYDTERVTSNAGVSQHACAQRIERADECVNFNTISYTREQYSDTQREKAHSKRRYIFFEQKMESNNYNGGRVSPCKYSLGLF